MDNLPFWLSCVVAVASILFSVFVSHYFLTKSRLAAAASTTSTDADLQEPIPRVSTSPTFPPGSNYQVFMSFHGEDTRTGFSDHLYHRLVDSGICVFRDDNNLRVGEEIAAELDCAINESKISITILSRGYASSEWCLRELTRAIERNKDTGHMVLPIFYKVKPSHVRHQTGSFGKAFRSLRNKPEAEKWKKALSDVTSMKGWESEKIANGYLLLFYVKFLVVTYISWPWFNIHLFSRHEGELIKLVVEVVLGVLKQDFQLDVPEHLVGIDQHVENIMRLIDINSSDTRMIGIYGMGGIGKTTLAKYIFNKVSHEFIHSFIANVREKNSQHGIEYLQEQLISDVLKCDTHVSKVDDGINIIKSMFRSKKVLIILDDVDHKSQLDDLTREQTWFGLGSRIIITTRDREVLDKAKFGVYYKYELQELNQELSLQLFSIHAFQKDSPPTEFKILSYKIIETTGGLPLGLEVIGSLLFGERDMGVWTDMLKKLRRAPPNEVQEKLKISYDALDYEAQQIFLDIACFFINWDKTYPIYMWDDLNFAPRMQIEILMRRSLIKMEGDKFGMHDQLRDLGRTIIHQANYDEPKNRCRLWDYEEASIVLDKQMESEKIRAICLYPPTYPQLLEQRRVYRNEVFEKLPNLRMFHSGGVTFAGDFQNSLPELRWLRWWIDDSCTELINFHPEKLVILELINFLITEDWAGWSSMKMSRLKVLQLRSCTGLRNSPDLSPCTNLEILSLEHCHELERIHPSIGAMKTLVSLNLTGCSKLKELPIELSKLQQLKELVVFGCFELEKLTNLSDLKCLTKLNLSICSKLTEVTGLEGLTSLTRLDAYGCPKLSRFDGLEHLEALNYLDMRLVPNQYPDDEDQVETQFFCGLKFLEHLNVSRRNSIKMLDLTQSNGLRKLWANDCKCMVEIRGLDKLEFLEELCIRGYKFIERLPDLSCCKSLKTLDINFCENLCDIESLGKFSSCQTLSVKGCHSLEKLPDLSNFENLQVLALRDCKKLVNISTFEKLGSLKYMDISGCKSITNLPNLSACKELKCLVARDCLSLTKLEGLENLGIRFLDISGCHLMDPQPELSGAQLVLNYESVPPPSLCPSYGDLDFIRFKS